MPKSKCKSSSRFLSYVLRHKPDAAELTLDAQGWVSVDDLLAGMKTHGYSVSVEDLQQIVETNNKQRFAFNADGTKIRASQGHSVSVELAYAPQTPPDMLYHGTVERFLADIQAMGLTKQKRHHVHLSPDRETATTVGARRGQPVILEIAAHVMHGDGHAFFLSENGVWLTEQVPSRYIAFPAS